jgi:hypothetical protein
MSLRFFFFLALSANRNEKLEDSEKPINIQDLYDKAQREHIPFHKWYQWIPEQLLCMADKPATEITTAKAPEIKLPSGECSICKGFFSQQELKTFEANGEKQFCADCYQKAIEMLKKTVIPRLNSQSNMDARERAKTVTT